MVLTVFINYRGTDLQHQKCSAIWRVGQGVSKYKKDLYLRIPAPKIYHHPIPFQRVFPGTASFKWDVENEDPLSPFSEFDDYQLDVFYGLSYFDENSCNQLLGIDSGVESAFRRLVSTRISRVSANEISSSKHGFVVDTEISRNHPGAYCPGA